MARTPMHGSSLRRQENSGERAVHRLAVPGYPLHEILSAPLVGLGGCTLSNAGTLVAALFLAALWYRISGKLAKNPLTLFFSLLCAPLVLTNARDHDGLPLVARISARGAGRRT